MPQSGKQRGLFITLEGIEGAGKSTQQDYIARLLIQRGHRVVQTREPGGTVLGEAIRRTLLAHAGSHAISHDTELLLMFAARCQHVDEIIRPNIEAGNTVLSDRFTDSSFAYQGGGRGIAAGRIRSLQQWVHPDLNPDLTLLLDLPVATGLERVGRRGESDRFEAEKLDFFEAVRSAYLDMAAAEPQRFEVIDANRSLAEIQADIHAVFEKRAIV